MDVEWVGITRELTEVLGLGNRPVAITFTNDEVALGSGKRTWVCRAMKLAAAGQSFVIDVETSSCPGGSWHCGLTPPPAAAGRRALQHFLTRGEKLTHSIVTFQRMQGLSSPPPTGLSERIVICPLDESPVMPDLVLFVCDAEQACRLIALDHFWDGKPPDIDMVGSLCHAAIGYPVMTGNTNVTFGDWTARRMQKYPSDAVFVTVPYERMANLVKAIPECSAGSAPVEIPEGLRLQMEDSGE